MRWDGYYGYVRCFRVSTGYTSTGMRNNTIYRVNYIECGSKSNTTYSKGSSNGTVTGINSSAYPSNGHSGSYWYVYKGVY